MYVYVYFINSFQQSRFCMVYCPFDFKFVSFLEESGLSSLKFSDGKDIHGFAKVSDARVAVARVCYARFDAPFANARFAR